MKPRAIIYQIVLVCTLIIFSARPVLAADAWTKLGRGIGNAGFGLLEIFRQPIRMGAEERWPIALFGGIPKGLVYGIGRELTGVYEIVTFPFPSYQPVMEPEFVIPRMD